MPDLPTYLQRIGYRGTPRPDVPTLVELHRRHLLAIPYENLDVQLGRPVGLDIGPIYEKIVIGRRGGWCYEMNGLLAWALEEIGFPVTRMAGGVGRAETGDAAFGNHLALRVDLEEPWLADVGFGDGIFEPVPIRAGAFTQRGLPFRLEALADATWRVHNHPHAGAPSFDFRTEPCERSILERHSARLQTSPDSTFRKVLVVERHRDDGLMMLRGLVLRRVDGRAVDERVVSDRSDFERVLREVFDLEPPGLDVLWGNVVEQHRAFVAAQAGAATVTDAGPRAPSASAP